MKKALLVGLIFIIVSLIFFYPFFQGKIPFPGDLLVGEYAPYNSYSFLGFSPGGYPNKGQDFDVLRLLYPEKEFSMRMFKNFELPLWNPHNFSGNPHIASLQSGSFYPLNIIFFVFPHITAWAIFIVLQPILTAIFTYLFARELNLSRKSSIFSSLAFAFSSYFIVWMEYGNIGHSILWMPFALWLSLKNLRRPSLLKSLAISLSLAFAILAGYMQTAFYVFVFVAGFVLFHAFFIDSKNRFKKLLLFSFIFILPLLLSALQLLPMFELFVQSARTPYPHSSFLKLLIPPFHLITAFVPDFFGNPATRNYWLEGTYIERVIYIGVVPLIFVLYSFSKKQNIIFWFFVISAVIVLLFTFNTYLSNLIYFFQLPLISTAVPTRMMFLFCFSASIIAGFGMEAFLKEQNKKTFLKVVGILGGIFILIWLFVFIAPMITNFSWIQNLAISRRNLILPTAIFSLSIGVLFISLFFNKYRKAIIVFIIVLSMMDLFYFFHKITPFAPREAIYPKTSILEELKKIQGIDRSWGYGSGYIATNLQTYEKIFSLDGYNALHLKRYGELLSSSRDGKIAKLIPRSDPMIAPGYGENDLRENKYRQRLLNLLGVKYVLNKNELLGSEEAADNNTFPKEIYKLVWQEGPWQIYENATALPRIFLAGEFTVERNKDKIIDLIFDERIDLRNKIILEESINPEINFSKDEDAELKLKIYTSNEISLQTESRTNMVLFISDNYYPGWEVKIDGESGKIYRANYSFRAVPISKGKHNVVFKYYPKSFDLGLKISLATFGLFVLAIVFSTLRKYYVKK